MNMIDFHTHVLPKLDDGSKSIDETTLMLKQIKAQNISTVIATPHFYANKISVDDFLKARNESVESLAVRLKNRGELLDMSLFLGAEVAYYDNISENENLEKLCIEGTKTLLLELSYKPVDCYVLSEIANISIRGITPVIAHCERYLKFKNSIEMFGRLIACGAKIQVNSDFFIGRLTKNKAMKLLKSNQIHVLGSDCHNMKKRKPNLDLAVKEIAKKRLSFAINQVNLNANELLEGAKVINL